MSEHTTVFVFHYSVLMLYYHIIYALPCSTEQGPNTFLHVCKQSDVLPFMTTLQSHFS